MNKLYFWTLLLKQWLKRRGGTKVKKSVGTSPFCFLRTSGLDVDPPAMHMQQEAVRAAKRSQKPKEMWFRQLEIRREKSEEKELKSDE